MPGLDVFVTFGIALFFLEITPGPDMMLIIARGLGQGRKVALFTVIGMIFIAGFVQVGLLVLGVASLLKAYPAALVALRWIGAIYLIWLGAKLVRASFKHESAVRSVRAISAWGAMREGTINSLTNPKSLLFMFTFIPQFVDPAAGPVWLQLLILGSLQKLVGIVSLGGVALGSGTVGSWLNRWPGMLAWQQRFTAAVMVGLGLRLLLSGGSASARP